MALMGEPREKPFEVYESMSVRQLKDSIETDLEAKIIKRDTPFFRRLMQFHDWREK